KVNARTGTIAWPEQALEPIYLWNNNYIGAPGYANQMVAAHEPEVEAQNRDYYIGTNSFNGASGVGSGLLSARPTTCTSGVAYWATDTNSLYKCTVTNQWTFFYTPYLYPHPLVSGAAAPPPPPTAPLPSPSGSK